MKIDQFLSSFQRFGVNLGLTRIQKVLTKLGNPEAEVPLIHVAGTNGKGSVCAYLSSVLTTAGYRVGRYTSPHLVDWTERICLNEQPITEADFLAVLERVKEAIGENTSEEETPTLFEVVTAAAWLYFAQEKVDVAVMEVGLGGRLDATNVKDQVLASIITPISREHWQVLGDTLTKIATEKAGVLKSHCPAFIAPQEAEAVTVLEQRTQALHCPTTWVKPATPSAENSSWAEYNSLTYPLPLLGEVQLTNSAVAVATLQFLQNQGWNLSTATIQKGMAKTRWLGRLQWAKWQGRSLLLDGAHNPAAAQGLRQYVETLPQPVTWIMGILSTKEQEKILKILLRPGDTLYTVPVPNHSTTPPEELCQMQQQTRDCFAYESLEMALEKVATLQPQPPTTILCGSLYLVGYFLGKLKGEQ
jgi:dihydrofolate synthase/folylpolyglutamate synthase